MNKQNKIPKKRIRAKYICKSELADLIQKANLIKEKLDDVWKNTKVKKQNLKREITHSFFQLLNDKYELIDLNKTEKLGFNHYLDSYLKLLLEEEMAASFNSDNSEEIYENYQNLMFFEEIAKCFQNKRDGKIKPYQFILRFNNLLTTIDISEDNTFEIKKSKLIKIIEGVNLDRIRSCEICQHIFWAKRSDSVTCSKKCLNVFGGRNHRKNAKLLAIVNKTFSSPI